MLGLSFTEIALILVVAFLILGPKELPNVIRALSQFMRQCREVIDECKAQLDGLADDSGIKELKSSFEKEKTYIRDQYGNLQETYDLSDIYAEQEQDKDHELAFVEENQPAAEPKEEGGKHE